MSAGLKWLTVHCAFDQISIFHDNGKFAVVMAFLAAVVQVA